MSLRAAIYARVSTDIQRENYSIPTQISDLLKHANLEGYTVVGDHYVDLITGKDTFKKEGSIPAFVDDYTSTELSRPGLNAALTYLERTGFDVLMVHAIDRLARDPYFRQTIEREVTARGARVEYILGNYDESPEGEVRKDLDSTFAKWENAKRVERSNRGKKRKAEMGKFVSGRAPFGYSIDANFFGGLVPYEPEANVVKMIFAWYVENKLSLRQIAKELTKRGIKKRQPQKHWTAQTLSRLVRYTVYAGYIYYNKRKRQGQKQLPRDKSEWIKIECTPLVSVEIFETAQEVSRHNKEFLRKHPKRFYLLSGMVICSDCERPYSAYTLNPGRIRIHTQQGYRHRPNQGHCCSRWISAKLLEPLVWEKIVSILLNPASLREGYEQKMEREQEKQERQIKHLEILQIGIEKLQAKKARLQAIYLDPDIGMTKEEYLSEKKILDDQIITANEDIERIGKELKKVPTESDLRSLEIMASNIVGALGNDLDISPQDKRKVMEMLNLKVLISPDRNIKLEGWFAPDSDGLLSTSWI
jgi:site-specific DNA recombinase